jgi:DNA-binding SARP family transcriptional activator
LTEFRLLGPVEVWAGHRRIDAGQPRQRTVLAALLVDAGRPVPWHTVVDRVWGESPPQTVRQSLRAHISRIRQVLRRAAQPGEAPVRVVSHAGGYLLDVEPDQVDVHRLRRLVGRSRDPDVTDERRVELLRGAMALWRGEPLAGLPGPWATRTRDAWQQLYLDAAVAWADAEIRSGRADAVVAPLRELAAEHPLAEPLVAMLMRALHASGRWADALACYATVRQRLVDEFGADPSSELQAVHRAILRGNRSTPPPRTPDQQARAPAPAQLPADVSAFTGRAAELTRLDDLLAASGAAGVAATAEPTAMAIAVVSGTGGVGKTALAVRWGHRMRAHFPDGQLYVDLRGYDPQRPVAAADALAGFLSALKVPENEIPSNVDDLASRYRTEAAGRRLLIVLDNAATAEQVRPLLPGSPSCAVLVTSRDSLAGLVAVQGAWRVELDLLGPSEAVALLRRLVGPRVDVEPAAAEMVAARCARLPLALRIAAELAARRPAVPLAELADELEYRRPRLDVLDGGADPRAAVTTVFSWSLRHLSPATARVFGLLGLHPGADVDAFAAAALAGIDPDRAREALEALARAHLVQPTAPGRYGMHDLLRAYAARLATLVAADPPAALSRMLDYYLAAAACAAQTLHPGNARRRTGELPVGGAVLPPVTEPDAARAWLDAERSTLTATVAQAFASGHFKQVIQFSAELYRELPCWHHTQGMAVHDHARRAAQRIGDLTGEARALLGTGSINGQIGRYAEANDCFRRAHALFEAAEDEVGQARALVNLGKVAWWLADYEEARNHHRRALSLYRRARDRTGEAHAHFNVGTVDERLGRYESALRGYQRALAHFRELGDRIDEAQVLSDLGVVATKLGRYPMATAHLEEALALFRRFRHPVGEAVTQDHLGRLHTMLDRPAAARRQHRRALALFREAGARDGEAWALNGLGEAARAADDPADALAQHLAALAVAVQTGSRAQQARAHHGLGSAHEALGDAASSREHYAEALRLYTRLRMPEADELRRELAGAGPRDR